MTTQRLIDIRAITIRIMDIGAEISISHTKVAQTPIGPESIFLASSYCSGLSGANIHCTIVDKNPRVILLDWYVSTHPAIMASDISRSFLYSFTTDNL